MSVTAQVNDDQKRTQKPKKINPIVSLVVKTDPTMIRNEVNCFAALFSAFTHSL